MGRQPADKHPPFHSHQLVEGLWALSPGRSLIRLILLIILASLLKLAQIT